MKEKALKGAFTVALAAVGSYFRQLAVPVILLAVVMVLDYATGLASAWIGRRLSSRSGLIGIIKKLGYMVLVAVAAVVDWVIQISAEQAGITVALPSIFALLTTIWLTLNECISILENLHEIGVPVPPFLLAVIQRLKKGTENSGGSDKTDANKKDGEHDGNGDK